MSHSLARLRGVAGCCTVIVGCCAAATSHQCPLEAAAHSPSRHRAVCTVPDTGLVVTLCLEPSSKSWGCSGCFWGAGSHPPAALQWGEAPQGPCPKGHSVPQGHPGCEAPAEIPLCPHPSLPGWGPPPHRNPALAPVHPGTYWSSPTFFTQAISRSDWSWGEQTFHQHPDPHPPAMWERGWWSRTAGSCPVPAPGCPAGASAPPAAARTRP